MQLIGRDFLTMGDFDSCEIKEMLDIARTLKKDTKARKPHPIMQGRTLATIFLKPSLRTRVSFDVGFMQLGGNVINIKDEEIKFGKREPIKDVGRNLSRYVDAIMIRAFDHAEVEELAKWADVPIINGLTDTYHPCQGLADILTVTEKFGSDLRGHKLTYIGDGNNVAHSLLYGGAHLGMHVTIISPGGYKPNAQIVDKASHIALNNCGSVKIAEDPKEAVKDSHVIYTDVWASMGQESEAAKRKEVFKEYQVNTDLLQLADPDCIVMHCLPAHREEEITDEVFEMHAKTIFDQAENRLHAQKAIMTSIIP